MPPCLFRSSKYARVASDAGRTISSAAPVTPHTNPTLIGSPVAVVAAPVDAVDWTGVGLAGPQAAPRSVHVARTAGAMECRSLSVCMPASLRLAGRSDHTVT